MQENPDARRRTPQQRRRHRQTPRRNDKNEVAVYSTPGTRNAEAAPETPKRRNGYPEALRREDPLAHAAGPQLTPCRGSRPRAAGAQLAGANKAAEQPQQREQASESSTNGALRSLPRAKSTRSDSETRNEKSRPIAQRRRRTPTTKTRTDKRVGDLTLDNDTSSTKHARVDAK
eukprot:14310828-Alexandrium_andersonii.AAC.1